MAVDFEKINSYREKIQPRDNTRVSNKLEPKLKKEEEKKLPDNRTYLSQAPSKEIIDANNLSHTLKQIQDFGDKLKQVGLDLRDYAAVGTSMLNPAAGMVLGLGDAGISAAKGDYVSGGVQAGLEMLPYGVGKLSKVSKLPDELYKLLSKTKIGEKIITKQQDKAFRKGIDEVIQMWNGSSDLSKYSIYKTPSGIEKAKYNLDKNILNRINRSKMDITDKSKYNVELDLQDDNLYNFSLYDTKGQHYQYKGKSNFEQLKKDFENHKDFSGFYQMDDDNYNHIVLRRRDPSGILIRPSQIRSNANHEATHLLQNNYGLTYDNINTKTGYGKMTSMNRVGQKLYKFLNQNNYWAMSGDELHADLWTFRVKHKIGTRDLTDAEAKQFVIENKRHFVKDIDVNNKDLINGIKDMATMLPVSISPNLNNE